MLKSFLISFVVSLASILLLACNHATIEISQEAAPKPQQEVVSVKMTESCKPELAIADIIFGEGSNQSLEGKYALGYFLISEAVKGNRTLCEELNYRMPGGDLKYSSMHKALKARKQREKTTYSQNLQEAKVFWETYRDQYHQMSKYNHYITLDLAIHKPPHWFKHYIVQYKIIGDHVFADLDFKNKHQVRKSGKYAANYQKLVAEINRLRRNSEK